VSSRSNKLKYQEPVLLRAAHQGGHRPSVTVGLLSTFR
jgi:hypothetical protein